MELESLLTQRPCISDRYTLLDPTNRFAYLADGFTELEHADEDRTADLAIKTRRFESHPALKKKVDASKSTVLNGGEYVARTSA
jgi:hypothetical protein